MRGTTARVFHRPALALALALVAGVTGAGCGGGGEATLQVSSTVVIRAAVDRAALGATLDGHGPGETGQIYTAANERAMRAAGLGPVAYRLRTELASEAWHWNPQGTWSGGACRCGYWTSSSRSGPRIAVSYGYRLPRRGNSIDQANNDGYSRIDDGKARSFWKSNPYVDPNPQWVMVDLGSARPVDGARIDWAQPYATAFTIQYWDGATPPARYGGELENAVFAAGVQGTWRTFITVTHGRGGRQLLRLASRPRPVRWLRILMTASSHKAPAGSLDARDRRGFAVAEVGIGLLQGHGLVDHVRHAAAHGRQSVVWVSSTDPWHRATDIDRAVEQPGFDSVFRSGLIRGPALVPVAVAYGTPDDAAAELAWLRARRYPVGRVELGEEPDGQLIGPEDYGTLYARFAPGLRRANQAAVLGGPGLATAVPDWSAWPDGHGTSSWTARLLAELARRRTALGFFSFEWYPFDDVCAPTGPQLRAQPGMLRAVLARQFVAGLSRNMPLAITEYGYSPFAASAEFDLAGGVIDASIAATFLVVGGRTAYLYGYEPDVPIRESARCATYGNLALLHSNDLHRAMQPTAAWWAMRLLTRRWLAVPGTLRPAAGGPRQLARYALTDRAGRLALLLINAADRSAAVRVRVGSRASRAADLWLLGPRQYVWHAQQGAGWARPDGPPQRSFVEPGGLIRLPAGGLAVLRER